MNLIRCLSITDLEEAARQIEAVGVDPTGIELMRGKALHFNLKVEGINPRTANILKQEMLSLGGDVALDGRGLDCSAQSTDGLLMGSQKQT
ncbi:MAG: dihydropteroate synthase, partial [Deltaproteobacteria bacterium]|nr:dihydropteroate synthase [Deltaproteobacteria bacterium]